MSSKRLSKRRDSRHLYLSVREKEFGRFHSDNDLTLDPSRKSAAAAAAAAATADAAAAAAAAAVMAAAQGGCAENGDLEFGSSSSVQTGRGDSSPDRHSMDEGGRGRAESLELGRQARIPLIRSSLVGRDLHPNGILTQHSSGGSSETVGGFSLTLSASQGAHEAAYLTIHGNRASQMQRRVTELMRDPAEHARMLQRYHELRELLAELRKQKLAKVAQLQQLEAKERELTSKQSNNRAESGNSKKCLPTQFLVAVDTDRPESDADSALSSELDSVKQDIAVQKAVLDAHIRLLREAKASSKPKHLRKQRAADYQMALERLSQLNLKARSIRDRMSNAEWYDDDSISQSSSFAFCNPTVGDASSLARSSSGYHSSPRNPAADYYSESLLSGQMYDARSLVSDLSRESSVRSAASANVPLGHAPMTVSQHGGAANPAGPPPVVPRRSGLGPNAKSGSQWRRSNSMGNLLAEETQAPSNTSFPAQLPPAQPAPYRRTSGADRGPSLSYRYQPRAALDQEAAGAGPPQLSASQQSPYWYTPKSRLEPAAAQQQQQQQRRHYKQYSDL